MREKRQKVITHFRNKGGITRLASILKAGFHWDTIRALEKEGKIEKVAWGL